MMFGFFAGAAACTRGRTVRATPQPGSMLLKQKIGSGMPTNRMIQPKTKETTSLIFPYQRQRMENVLYLTCDVRTSHAVAAMIRSICRFLLHRTLPSQLCEVISVVVSGSPALNQLADTWGKSSAERAAFP